MIQIEGVSGELSEGTTSTSALLMPELKSSFPEIERATRVSGSQLVVSRDDKSFTQLVVHVDPDFFSMFSFPIIRGDAASPLGHPESVVLTPEMAEKFFGDDDAVGKTLSIQLGDTKHEFLVSGIIESAPSNSSIQYDMLISTDLLKFTIPEDYLQTWNMILFSTFVQVSPDADLSALEERISAHITKLSGHHESGDLISFHFQPLLRLHLNPKLDGEMVPSSDPIYSIILSAIAFAVLVIACINFMTLAVGRSGTRAREIGLRKVLGAQRGRLMMQFWGESLLMSIGALVLGVILTEALLPKFNDLAQKHLTLSMILDFKLLAVLIGLTLLTAFMAGIYPALLLSKRSPVEAMLGEVLRGRKNRIVQGLVVFQFVISVFLIAGTFIMSSQMDYVGGAYLGYDREHVVLFPTGTEQEDAASLLERFRSRVARLPSVVDVTGYTYQFGESWLYLSAEEEGWNALIGENITAPGYASKLSDDSYYFYMNWIDPHFIPTMGINVVDGRNFSDDYLSDSNDAIIINQTALREFGLDDAVGQKLPKGFGSATIVGVVEDFHFYPLQRSIEPLVLHMPRHDDMSSVRYIAVRISGEGIPATLSMLEHAWSEASNGMPFDYKVLDDEVNSQYVAEQRWKRIVEYSSILSVLITCLGLFGLTSLSVAKRTREVGIRKTFGASVPRVVAMFIGLFARLALIGNLIAWPLAYLVMTRWLEHFAYRTSISIAAFMFTGLLTMAVAMLTVIYQAARAALANPVDALRHE